VVAMLETIGELTSRETEAEKLVADVRDTFGR
jgi:ABC-type Fe3+-hydroxamate transport system substrate-binding protein